MSKKTSLKKSVGLFLFSISLVLSLRWIGFEPFVIPSGSMMPTLLIHDHIVVTKFSFGLRLPFSRIWLFGPYLPEKGDVVVFRSVEKENYFMIKRVVGLPGDKITFTEEGRLVVNDQPVFIRDYGDPIIWSAEDLSEEDSNFNFYLEKNSEENEHLIMLDKNTFRYTENELTVSEGHIYLMGDNRDRSRDSRFWGELPLENILGKAQYVWLSCTDTLVSAGQVCDPAKIRWNRIFHKIK